MSLRQYIIFVYMNNTSIDLYDYNLPKEQIASEPLDHREQSKLLHLTYNDLQTYERKFYDLLDILNPGDLLILNNTRVFQHELICIRKQVEKSKYFSIGKSPTRFVKLYSHHRDHQK